MTFDELLQFVRSDQFDAKVCADSRKVSQGDIFAAVVGTHVDGHDYIPVAIDKGASWIVCHTPKVQANNIVIVEDSSAALGLLAQAASGEPARKLINLSVTGTNGKTTVAHITRSIVAAAGCKCGLIGTIIYDSASEPGDVLESSLTTPDALTIAGLMAKMVSSGAKYMVTEASSHALSQNRLAGIDFAAAAFTNLTGDHLDYHQTKEKYLAEKTKLFTSLSPDAVAVLNRQSDEAQIIASKTNAKIFWYAVDESADICAKVISMDANRTCYELTFEGQTRPVKTTLIGKHNISNQLAAAGLCFAVGIDIDIVAKGIEQTVSVPGRLDPVDAGQDYAVFVDYAHTDDALKNVLVTLKPLCKNNLTVLFGCGGDRDKTKRPRMAAVAEQYADRIIVTSDNPRTESPQAIIEDILKGFSDAKAANITVEPDRKKAIELAVQSAQKDDIILLAGKGHETYQLIGDKKFDFNDKTIAMGFIRTQNTEYRTQNTERRIRKRY